MTKVEHEGIRARSVGAALRGMVSLGHRRTISEPLPGLLGRRLEVGVSVVVEEASSTDAHPAGVGRFTSQAVAYTSATPCPELVERLKPGRLTLVARRALEPRAGSASRNCTEQLTRKLWRSPLADAI